MGGVSGGEGYCCRAAEKAFAEGGVRFVEGEEEAGRGRGRLGSGIDLVAGLSPTFETCNGSSPRSTSSCPSSSSSSSLSSASFLPIPKFDFVPPVRGVFPPNELVSVATDPIGVARIVNASLAGVPSQIDPRGNDGSAIVEVTVDAFFPFASRHGSSGPRSCRRSVSSRC